MKTEQGFTLIEALAAIGLSALVVLALMEAFNYNTSTNVYSKDRLIAMNDARNVTPAVVMKVMSAPPG